MNPLWFFVGLEVGDRLRDPLNSLICSSWHRYLDFKASLRRHATYRDWLASLPETVERG